LLLFVVGNRQCGESGKFDSNEIRFESLLLFVVGNWRRDMADSFFEQVFWRGNCIVNLALLYLARGRMFACLSLKTARSHTLFEHDYLETNKERSSLPARFS
jgi:hypothetical protein